MLLTWLLPRSLCALSSRSFPWMVILLLWSCFSPTIIIIIIIIIITIVLLVLLIFICNLVSISKAVITAIAVPPPAELVEADDSPPLSLVLLPSFCLLKGSFFSTKLPNAYSWGKCLDTGAIQI